MFLGTFTPKFDDQGRFLLPADHRSQLKDGLVITRAPDDPCLEIWPAAKFKADVIKATKKLDRQEAREYQRKVASAGSYKSPDGQGRVTIPPALRDFAGITKDITLLGAMTHVEVWDTPTWEKHLADEEDKEKKKREGSEPAGAGD